MYIEYYICRALGFANRREMRRRLTPEEFYEWLVFLRMEAKGEKPYPSEEVLNQQIARFFGGSSRELRRGPESDDGAL